MKSIIVLLNLIMMATCLEAYCIYNDLPEGGGTFWIRQQPDNAGGLYTSRFSREALGPGDKACCPYTTSDCVKSTNKEDIVSFTFRRTSPGLEYPPVVINCPGGGWITMGGGNDPVLATIDVFNPDGTPYNFQYRVDHQAGYL
ncbi:uncharacterized protein EV154DRAFT_564108 [Mucor mucedo]|uniref:uncharacterized protein n=1 Tax=Mucor mucedo TaxID=29922 RepID=UPI00221FEDDB|nr:uncharacterized protein EV154DRAFT_564108 [Mucor mucedo]KAI7890683.1 hypothetical protein EV154DRAFT_564108 [Mucor mucedo]